MSIEFSSPSQIDKFFYHVGWSIEHFIDLDVCREVRSTKEDNLFLALVPVCDPDKIEPLKDWEKIIIEKLDGGFNLQYQYRDNDIDDIVVKSDTFLGRKCAVLYTLAQCRHCNDAIHWDMNSQRNEIYYM